LPERERLHGQILLSAQDALQDTFAASSGNALSFTAFFSPELAPASAVGPEEAALAQQHVPAAARSRAAEAAVLAQPHVQAASRESPAAAVAASAPAVFSLPASAVYFHG
jgi:hypothetical protein